MLEPSAAIQTSIGLALQGLFSWPLQLLLQGTIDFINALQAAADRRDHLLLKAGELLFSIGVINPAALQGLLRGMPQDALHRLERGFQLQEWIFLGRGKSGSNVGGCHGDQRQCGAAMGPSPGEARHQEGLRLERPGASPFIRGNPLSCSERLLQQRGRHGRES